MHTAKSQGRRESSMRGFVDENMASVDYRLKPGPSSPYTLPQAVRPQPPSHRPEARLSVEEYMKTKKGAKKRYLKFIALVSAQKHSNLKLSMFALLNYLHPHYLLHQNKLHYIDQHLIGYNQSVSGILDLSLGF